VEWFHKFYLKNPPLYNFTKIRPLCAEYFHADRQRSHMAYPKLAFAYCFMYTPEILTWPI